MLQYPARGRELSLVVRLLLGKKVYPYVIYLYASQKSSLSALRAYSRHTSLWWPSLGLTAFR